MIEQCTLSLITSNPQPETNHTKNEIVSCNATLI